MLFAIIGFIAGLILLWKSSDWLVDGALALGLHFKIPKLILGLTFVAFGTSAPELVVNLLASFKGQPDIIWGNILGSNISNTFLILGILGFFGSIHFCKTALSRDLGLNLILLGVLSVLIYFGFGLNWMDGLILLIIFHTYLFWIMLKSPDEVQTDDPHLSMKKAWGLFVLGLVALPLSAKLVVDGAIALATFFGVSTLFISLFLVALGTSLPELVTSVNAAMKGHTELATGNILGSNIFNILLILGINSLVSPIPFVASLNLEIVLLALSCVWIWACVKLASSHHLERWGSLPLLAVYIGYLVFIYVR